jgi:hypothetical protein
MEPIQLSLSLLAGIVCFLILRSKRKGQEMEEDTVEDTPLPVPSPNDKNLLAQYRDLPIQQLAAPEPAPVPANPPPKRKTLLVEAVECAYCGKPFLPVNGNQRYCNEVCRTQFHKNKANS